MSNEFKIVAVPACDCGNPDCVLNDATAYANEILNYVCSDLIKKKISGGKASASLYLALVQSLAIVSQVYPEIEDLLVSEFDKDLRDYKKMLSKLNTKAPGKARPDIVSNGVPFFWSKG